MDCDDVILLLAHEARTLTGRESALLEAHVAECEACEELVARGQARPSGPLDMPTVDPATFEAKHVIAAGGMGQISSAIDRRLGRDVAIKEMLTGEQRDRFEREVAITARLQHPAIVPVYEAGRWPDGNAFYTMRLVPGGTLGAAFTRATGLAQRLLLLPHVLAVTDALAYAHSRGIIHRDLKPQNVLVGEFGETVVIDWGLARAVDDDTNDELVGRAGGKSPELTAAGAVVGSPCFMAPEQARGEPLDERSDVFALGALLYNLLTGQPPYWDLSHDSQRLIEAVLAQPPTPLEAIVPDAPEDLRAIVSRAMAREPRDRFATAGELAAELRRFQAGQLLVSREYRLRDLVARWFRRHRTFVVAASAVALVAVVAVALIVRARGREDTAFERGQRKLCESEVPQLASPWDDAARDQVHRGFAATKLPYVSATLDRVDSALASWSTELATARDRVCPAHGDAAPRAQLAAQLDCLHDRVRDARTLISQLEAPDVATVLNAIAATEQLAPATRCTIEAPARVVPVASPALTDVRELFARTHALMQLGKFRAALPLAEQAVAGAAALDAGTRAQALVVLGSAQLGTSSYDAAATSLANALRLAETAQDDRTRAQAWTNIVRVEYLRGHFAQAVAMRDAALGATERIGDVYLQTEIMINLGGALDQLGKSTEAQALYEQAVALRRSLYGARDYRVANALSALGNAYAMQGKLDAGIAAHREAATIAEAALGDGHPNLGIMLGNLGSDYTYGLRATEAVGVLERGLAIVTAANGGKHRDAAMAMTDLGTAQLEAGQLDAALATFERADAVWLELNAKHPARADVLLGRYLALRGLGKPAATADLDTALALAAAGLPPFELARIQLALGLASTGPAAQKLIAAAAKGFATAPLPLCRRELAVANAWLAAHPQK